MADRELTFDAAIESLSKFVQQKMRLMKEREMPVIDPKSTSGEQMIRNSAFEKPTTQGDPPPTSRIASVDWTDIWILENQILPNQYGLKHAALRRVIDSLRAVSCPPNDAERKP